MFIKKPDVFNSICTDAIRNFKALPKPLSWIEPSVNTLYLEAVSSFVFSNYVSSIISMGVLLEHTLKAAISDPVRNMAQSGLSFEEIYKKGSVRKILTKYANTELLDMLIPSEESRLWWDEVAYFTRNKSAHFIVDTLLRKFGGAEYHGIHAIIDEYGEPLNERLMSAGSLFHRSDYIIAKRFLNDGTKELRKLIANTQWKSSEDDWRSQKAYYDAFFSFQWDVDGLKESLNRVFNDVGASLINAFAEKGT